MIKILKKPKKSKSYDDVFRSFTYQKDCDSKNGCNTRWAFNYKEIYVYNEFLYIRCPICGMSYILLDPIAHLSNKYSSCKLIEYSLYPRDELVSWLRHHCDLHPKLRIPLPWDEIGD